jgi:hypothetical protein
MPIMRVIRYMHDKLEIQVGVGTTICSSAS